MSVSVPTIFDEYIARSTLFANALHAYVDLNEFSGDRGMLSDLRMLMYKVTWMGNGLLADGRIEVRKGVRASLCVCQGFLAFSSHQCFTYVCMYVCMHACVCPCACACACMCVCST